MTASRPIPALAGALLALLAAGAAAPAQARDRQRLVQGWMVEDRSEEDGGRLVRMSRTAGPWRLEYQVAFWRGNDGILQRLSALGGGCSSDEALDRHRIPRAAEIRAQLETALAQCAASRRAVRAALRGLEPAYALTRTWTRENSR